MASNDLSSIVLLFNNIQGSSNVGQLSENARFMLRLHDATDANFWKGNQSNELFGLVFQKNMYTPEGWRFGSSDDTDVCDFQLAENNRTSVSRQHLKFDIEPITKKPRVKVLSRNPIKISILATERKRKITVLLNQGEVLDIDDVVKIDLGDVSFHAWQPTLSVQDRTQYRRNAEQLSEQFLDSILRFPMNLNHTGTSTFIMRFGQHNACYKRFDDSQARSGGFATVHKVRELRSGNIYAAKVPHFRSKDTASVARKRWEGLLNEFDLSKILHVCHRCAKPGNRILTNVLSAKHCKDGRDYPGHIGE